MTLKKKNGGETEVVQYPFNEWFSLNHGIIVGTLALIESRGLASTMIFPFPINQCWGIEKSLLTTWLRVVFAGVWRVSHFFYWIGQKLFHDCRSNSLSLWDKTKFSKRLNAIFGQFFCKWWLPKPKSKLSWAIGQPKMSNLCEPYRICMYMNMFPHVYM